MVATKINGQWTKNNQISSSKSFDNTTKEEVVTNTKNNNLQTKWGDKTLQEHMKNKDLIIDWNNKDLFDAKNIRYKTDKEKILEKYEGRKDIRISGNKIEKWDSYSYRKEGSKKRKEREDVEHRWDF